MRDNKYSWVDNPDFQLFKHPDPNKPEWCAASQSLVFYGEKLLSWVRQQISRETIAYAQFLLEQRYWELYNRVTDEHRRDERHASHPCLHRAYREIREALEDAKFDGRIDDFLPAPVRVIATRAHPVIEVDPEPFDELPGIFSEGDELA